MEEEQLQQSDRQSFSDLKKRKVEEQRKLRNGNGSRWQEVVSRKEQQRRKKLINREEWLRKCTSFYVSNLPVHCTSARLGEAFAQYGKLEDVFIPRKSHGGGNRFGFIRFSGVLDMDGLLTKLRGVRIEGAVVEVNPVKYYRDGTKVTYGSCSGETNLVLDRLGKDGNNTPDESQGGDLSGSQVGVSGPYLNALNNNRDRALPGLVIYIPPLVTMAKRCWELKSLIGEAKEVNVLEKLDEILCDDNFRGSEVRYMGGMKVLLSFQSSQEADAFLRSKFDVWSTWFSRCYVWDGSIPIFERIAWVKVIGVPICLWDRSVFNRIGERCGRLVCRSVAEVGDGDISGDKLAVLVNTGTRIERQMEMKWKNQLIKVWVRETDEDWSPAFLKHGGRVKSEPGSPVTVSAASINGSTDKEDEELEFESEPGSLVTVSAASINGTTDREDEELEFESEPGSPVTVSAASINGSTDKEDEELEFEPACMESEKEQGMSPMRLSSPCSRHTPSLGNEKRVGGPFSFTVQRLESLVDNSNSKYEDTSGGAHLNNNVISINNGDAGNVLHSNGGVVHTHGNVKKDYTIPCGDGKLGEKSKSVKGSSIGEYVNMVGIIKNVNDIMPVGTRVSTPQKSSGNLCLGSHSDGQEGSAAAGSPLPFSLSFAPKPRKKGRPKFDPLDLTLGSGSEMHNLSNHDVPRNEKMDAGGKKNGKFQWRSCRVRKGVRVSRFKRGCSVDIT